MPQTLERDEPERRPSSDPANTLTSTHLAKLATYMNGGTVFIAGRTFDFKPRRETVEDNLKVDFEIACRGLGGNLELRVKDVDTHRAYKLGDLGIDLIDRTDPVETWIHGKRETDSMIRFDGLMGSHVYELVFRGEEGGVGAKLPSLPLERRGEERKEP